MTRGSATAERDWLTVARLVKTQGRRGELAAELLTDFPERLASRTQVFLREGEREPRPVQVEKSWFPAWSARGPKSYLIFKFAGCDSLAAAREMIGLEVQIPRGEAAALPSGSFLVSDLVGCRVVERATGRELGRVRELIPTGGTDLLAVESPEGRELWIPFAQEICPSIDSKEKRIEVELPPGLLELNSP